MTLLIAIACFAVALALVLARAAARRAHHARLALEPAAPAPPVPAARQRPGVPDRELAAVRAPAPSPHRVLVEGEIEHAEGRFRLRPLGPRDAAALDGIEIASAPVDAAAVAARTDVASREHALLCDMLIAHGWEPCGRGLTWYAHRYRRTV
jgi:hypothetical protein